MKENFNLRVLIIEDSNTYMSIIADMLSKYSLHKATSAKEGLAKFKVQTPDITFLDLTLPDGDGHVLLKEIRKINPSAFIIMTTGTKTEESVKKAAENKVDGYIVKPYSRQQIELCIDKFFAQKDTN